MMQPCIVLRVFVLPQTLTRGRLCSSVIYFFLIPASDFTILIFRKSLTAVILLL